MNKTKEKRKETNKKKENKRERNRKKGGQEKRMRGWMNNGREKNERKKITWKRGKLRKEKKR